MKRRDVKSRCPINFSLEIFGDPWSLLILRGMLAVGNTTFTEFLEAEERIGTSVLTERLAHLEKNGIIVKLPNMHDKRKTMYQLTEAGIDAVPILYEIAAWGSRTSPHPKAAEAWFKALELDKEVVIKAWRDAARAGSSFFTGPDSVVRKLGL